MLKYNPKKMIPIEALGPYFRRELDEDGIRKIKMLRLSADQKRFMKDYHTRRARRENKKIEE